MHLECRDIWVKFKLYSDRQRFLRWTLLNMLKGTFHHESFWAVQGVSFAIRPGETFGIIGENGSGKSTLLKVIAGIIRPDKGELVARGRISALLELGAGFQPDLTGRENIYLNGSIMGLTRSEIAANFDKIVAFSELEDFIDTPVKHYSSGMYMRLGFSIAINVNPDILLIDEVLAVGDLKFQERCVEKIREFKRRGKTIIFVSHDLHTVRELCKRAVWLNDGRVAAVGSTERVIDFYRENIRKDRAEELEEHHQHVLEEVGNRWGSKEIEITEVRFQTIDGKSAYQFKTGDTIVAAIRYHAHRRIEKPVFGVSIHRSDGIHINGPNTKLSGDVIAAVEGEGTVYHTMNAVPLLPGTYYFSAAVYDYDCVKPYDHHDQLFTFSIVEGGTREQWGLVQLDTSWRYDG
ncbi:ABC transporter ATP-binding protein [bacterium]|nr:ABC transporter ATP-binding protein [candidate division CSSED10-310 bacterium]